MITVTTLLLALGLALGVFLLRKRFSFNRRSSEQDADARQLEQRLSQVAKQGTEQVTLAVLQLEEKLEQANATIEELRYHTQLAEGLLWQKQQSALPSASNETPDDSNGLSSTEPTLTDAAKATELAEPVAFSQRLAVAAYQLSQETGAPSNASVDGGLTEKRDIAEESNQLVDSSTFSVENLPDDKALRYEQVAALAAGGMNEVDIAKRLDLGVGEVRLAAQLLQNRRTKSG